MAKFLFISDKKIMVTLHAIAWIIIIIIPLYLNSAFGGGNNHRMYEFYLHTLSAGVIFYVGYLWLVPRFFLQKRQLTYLLILIGLIIATHLITNFIEERFLFDPIRDEQFREALKNIRRKDENFRPPMKAFGFFNHFLSSVLLSGFAIGLGVMEKLKENEKKQKELEKEKLNSELAFLKNQVSPHFFFNTLNNIYSLIELNTTDAQEAVMKLSRLMRYLLYESEHGVSVPNQFYCMAEIAPRALHVSGLEYPVVFPRGIYHSAAFGNRKRHRFLAVNIFSGFGSINYHLGMPVVGRNHYYCINIFSFQHFAVVMITVNFGAAAFFGVVFICSFCQGLKFLFINIADGNGNGFFTAAYSAQQCIYLFAPANVPDVNAVAGCNKAVSAQHVARNNRNRRSSDSRFTNKISPVHFIHFENGFN